MIMFIVCCLCVLVFNVPRVSVVVCAQLAVSGDVCMRQLSGWWWCVFIEVYTTVSVVVCTQLFVWWCVFIEV